MNKDEHHILITTLQSDWGLELTEVVSEDEIIDKLALRLASIAEKGPDTFFQLMYRLDIPEKQLLKAIYDKETAKQLARLVYNRQIQKIRSREYYKGKHTPGTDDLTW